MKSPILSSGVSLKYFSSLHNLLFKNTSLRIFVFAAFLSLLLLSGASTVVKAQLADSLNANVAGGAVLTSVVQADGKIIIGGDFTSVLGEPRNNIARLNADGTLDTTFNPDANGAVTTLALESNGQILVGGYFTTIGGESRNNIARLDPTTGAADPVFNPNPTSTNPDGATGVLSIKVQPDGKILVGGFFTDIGGQMRNNIARLDPVTGAAEATFNPNVNGDVNVITLQPNGKILIGGNFDTVSGTSRNFVARLNVDGSLDTTFNPSANDAVLTIAVQSNGQILLGGNFTAIGGVTRNFIARVNADGTLDTAFNPNANDAVFTILVQPDGKILVGGAFTTIGGASRNFIARLNSANGSADTFNPNADGQVFSLTLQPDNKVLVGGTFSNIGGASRNLFARLNNIVSTAATATISGRVTVRGRGLARAFVTISDSNGMVQRTMTNLQGFYQFENIPTGSTYVFDVESKRFSFASQVVSVTESISDLNFLTR